MKILQLNLGRGRDDQDLLTHTARESGTDVVFNSEQYKWSEHSAWYQDASKRAGILVFSPVLGVGDFLESDSTVQLLLLPQRSFRGLREPDTPP